MSGTAVAADMLPMIADYLHDRRISLTRSITLILLLLVPAAVQAGDWKGEAAAGLQTTSGNSETQSLNGRFALDYLSVQWKNAFLATGLNSGNDEGSTSERYTVGNKLDYNFDPKNFVFAAVDYEKDLFGGFRQRTVESVGYGRHILTGPRHTLDADIGGGARHTEEQVTGKKEDDFIGRLGGKYALTISETSGFTQTVKVEAGFVNTFTEAVSELKLSVIGNIFVGLSFTLRNNSDVPADTKRTDSFTSINLSYRFGKT
ncbi:MAG: DUF481 domain-containing protein [Panacagrimonas sp.]